MKKKFTIIRETTHITPNTFEETQTTICEKDVAKQIVKILKKAGYNTNKMSCFSINYDFIEPPNIEVVYRV
jgi:hypothetical protein